MTSGGQRGPTGHLLTLSFVLLSLADLAYFTAGGMLLATTPLFAVRVLGAGLVGVGVAMVRSA